MAYTHADHHRYRRSELKYTCDASVDLGGQETFGADRRQPHHPAEGLGRAFHAREIQGALRACTALELERFARHLAQHLLQIQVHCRLRIWGGLTILQRDLATAAYAAQHL